MMDQTKLLIKEIIIAILFVVSLGMLIWGLNIYFYAYHNIDICHNLQKASIMFNTPILEQTTSGETWELSACYLSGLKTIVFFTIFVIIPATFLVGMIFMRYVKNNIDRIY